MDDLQQELSLGGVEDEARRTGCVNARVWFADQLGTRAVFVGQTPFYTYSLTAQVEHRFCAAQLVEAGLASASDVCKTFGLTLRTFSRVRAQLRKGGIAALVPQPLGRHSANETTAAKPLIRNLYQQGKSTYEIADVVGFAPRTVGRVLKELGVPRRLPGGAGGARPAPLFVAETADQLVADRDEQVAPDVAAQNWDAPHISSASNDDSLTHGTECVAVSPPHSFTLQHAIGEAVSPSLVANAELIPAASATPSEIVSADYAEVATPVIALVSLSESAVVATSIPYASPLQRLFTTLGLVEEAPVEFQSADNVPHAGVLLGLALLGDTHLLSEARAVYGALKNSWYGLRSVLFTLLAMALLRIKRPEQLKHRDPAGLGCVLGLPRAAEVKTLRRKLDEIANRRLSVELHRRLAQRRAEDHADELATLYIDGHVRTYHGRHRIGKTYVSRQKSVQRGETDFWVHLPAGQPLLVIHNPPQSSFREVLTQEVLPEIRRVVGESRVRVIFDREGWCRELFRELLRQGFDFTTYRKGPYPPLPDDQFHTVTHDGPSGERVTYDLAESVFAESGWPTLRLVAVNKQNGEQTHIVSTGCVTWAEFGQPVGADYVEPSETATAWWMFGRWTQENWFKYMEEQFALDVLVDYRVEAADGEQQVVNPRWRELDRQTAAARSQLQRAQAKYAQTCLRIEAATTNTTAVNTAAVNTAAVNTAAVNTAASPSRKSNASSATRCPADVPCGECLTCQLSREAAAITKCQTELDDLRATRRATPKQICLRDATDRDLVTLSFDSKLFTDTVKICAYEIETRLCRLLAADFGRSEQEGRSLIRDLLQTPGDVRVTGNELTIHLEQRSAPRYTQGLQSLCTQLNALTPTLPETAYRLRFHVKPRPVGE